MFMSSIITSSVENVDSLNPLLPKPDPPLPSDCCGTGCSPCVHDIYEEDLRTWKQNCKKLNSNCNNEEVFENENGQEILSCKKYNSFKIIDMKQITENTFNFVFELPNTRSLGVKVGQHIVIKGILDDQIITRPYTSVSDISTKGKFELLIKIYQNGKMSSVVSKWKIGDLIEAKGPYGSFKYKSNTYQRVLMLAAGTGIAPMIQVIKYILNNEEDLTKIHVMYASKSFKDILLRDDLYALQSYWNFTVCHYLSQEDRFQDKKYSEEVQSRKLTKQDVTDEILKSGPQHTLILISGTKSFDKDMVNAALDASDDCKNNLFRF